MIPVDDRAKRPRPEEARWRREAGLVGGIEVLPFGVLVFVAGMMLIANAWAVVDAKLAATAAAREAGRAYVEAADPTHAELAARRAAREVTAGAGRDPDRLHLAVQGDQPGQAAPRCAVIVHVATYTVPAVALPFLGSWGGGVTVRGRHRDVIDPFASGRPGEAECDA